MYIQKQCSLSVCILNKIDHPTYNVDACLLSITLLTAIAGKSSIKLSCAGLWSSCEDTPASHNIVEAVQMLVLLLLSILLLVAGSGQAASVNQADEDRAIGMIRQLITNLEQEQPPRIINVGNHCDNTIII